MKRSLVAVLLASICSLCFGQVQTGQYNYGAFDNKQFDTINIGNLNVNFALPVYSKPGRGLPFYYFLAYNSSIWSPLSAGGSAAWTPNINWGWTADTDAHTGWVYYGYIDAGTCTVGGHHMLWLAKGDPTYYDQLGGAHSIPGYRVSNAPTCTGYPTGGAPVQVSDGSGLSITLYTTANPTTVTAASGKVVNPTINALTGSGLSIDPNGNEITINTSGQVTDTTGNTVLTISVPAAPSATTYAYTDTANNPQQVTVNYGTYTVQTAFGCTGISEYGPNTEYLISSIGYPDGTSYSFTYEATPGAPTNTTGRLASVTLPEGGVIRYSYSGGNNGIECKDGGTAALARSMPNDPLAPSTTYTRTPGTNSSHTEVIDGLSNYAEYDFVNDPSDPNNTPYLVNHVQYQGSATGTPLISEQSCLNGATPSCTGQSLTLPIVSAVTTSTFNGSAVKQSAQTLNSYGLLADDKEYDFGSSAPGAEIQETQISYATLTNGIVSLPSTITNLAPSGGSMVPIRSVSYGYDQNTLSTTSGLPQHISVTGSRGNLTSLSYSTGAGTPSSITTHQALYDDAGQLLSSKDTHLNSTSYSYDSGTDAFLIGITYPSTGGVGHSTNSTYDAIRGVKLTDVDVNGNTTTYTYDSMLRPSSVSAPGGGYQTNTYALGATSPYTSVSTLHATGGSNITSTSYLDPYGRLKQTDSTDTPSDDLVDYAYDANGNLASVSNPYRTGGAVAYTSYIFDALGRLTKATDSDGSSQRQASFSGNSVTLTDETGNLREVFADGLDRTEKVLEPDNSGSIAPTNALETDYQYAQSIVSGSGSSFTTYNTVVTQKGSPSNPSTAWRIRTFTSDMLGRLVSEATPEAATITYTYPNGSGSCAGDPTLSCGRADANGTSTTYSYDALNRLTGKAYGGSSVGTGTAGVTYYYDQTSYNGLTISNGNWQRTGMSDGSGNTAWSYDGRGRVAAVRKTINSVTKQANYTYNADGTVNTFQDFGGTTFTYAYNSSGRPTSLSDGSANSYASGASYSAAGHLTSLNHQLTSGSAAYARSVQYNNRMQPSIISATLNGSTIQSLSYGYGSSGTNNGNILSITNGIDSTRSQSFSYDTLNRLQSAHDASHWGETYTYDNWGNLYQTSRMSGYTNGNNWIATTVTNHNQFPSNLSYDSSGEVTQDQFGNTYTYDAEGRLQSAGSGTYVYDGDGNRVKKTASGVATLYWNGATSLLDESDSTATTMAKQVNFAGLPVWSESVTSGGRVLLQDHLGSTRMTGTSSGTVQDDVDYYSFGSVENNYGVSPSDNHYTFTGYESDQSESSTDYAVFRNLGTEYGRFNRPDPYNGSYIPENPQSLNRYSYAMNMPVNMVDPLGLSTITVCTYQTTPVFVVDIENPGTNHMGSDSTLTCFDVSGQSAGPSAGGSNGGSSGSSPQPKPKKPCIPSLKTRLLAGSLAVANTEMVALKTGELEGADILLGASTPVTGPAGAAAAAIGTAYEVTSISGQAVTAASEYYVAFGGNSESAEELSQAGDILSGPVSMLTVLPTRGPEAAQKAAVIENSILGLGGVTLSQTFRDLEEKVLDFELSTVGISTQPCKT